MRGGIQMEVFYFHVHYGYDFDGWQECDEYGFILAKNFVNAMEQIVDYYKDDLLGVEIQYTGDSGMISVNNKGVAEAFRKSYIETHYGEEE
jgi:hypothetical protein